MTAVRDEDLLAQLEEMVLPEIPEQKAEANPSKKKVAR